MTLDLAAKAREIAGPQPEPCLKGRCWSPTACGGWGYCRERNMEDRAAPTDAQVAERQRLATGASR